MAAIGIDNLKPGMVLIKDVKTMFGRLILRAGMELTERSIMNLKAWGVTEAEVGDSGDNSETPLPEDSAISQETMERAEKETMVIFGSADMDNPVMAELFRLCVLRKARRLSGAHRA